ncbi:MAG: ankyrin repeat domain-containing protein, partial [Proteobacteria bacterium]|nr:ankyrin repeat domain-containing protein [Pseudomonadota bacterium]
MISYRKTWLLAGLLCLVLWPVHASAQDVQVDEIHDAAGEGDAERVTDLLLARPDLINAKTKSGLTPLHFAAEGGHKAVVELLLDNEADPNVKGATGSTPLHLAIPTFRIEDVVPKLRDAGLTDKNVEEYYRVLGQGGDASTIASSFPEDIDFGVIRETIIQSSLPPVEAADRVAVVRLLIEEGADVNASNSLGQTPLTLAAMNPDRIMTA